MTITLLTVVTALLLGTLPLMPFSPSWGHLSSGIHAALVIALLLLVIGPMSPAR